MNHQFAWEILQKVIDLGTLEFCICPGKRMIPFYQILKKNDAVKSYYWFEERSAAFYALGRSRATNRPVAVICTSGTAAGELLPATMEAFHTGAPLILLTTDRPRRLRGTGAPQTADQVGIYGTYAPVALDISIGEDFSLDKWDRCSPLHLNICFDEPLIQNSETRSFHIPEKKDISHPKDAVSCFAKKYACSSEENNSQGALAELTRFLEKAQTPLVIVSTLKIQEQEAVIAFLEKLNAPVILEGVSGIREESRLSGLRINQHDHFWNRARECKYEIDSVIRIGGVPTLRFWRDLDEKLKDLPICSVSSLPFPGLSHGLMIQTSLENLEHFVPPFSVNSSKSKTWITADCDYQLAVQVLFEEEPLSEQALMHVLSTKISPASNIYLGNSLPIREWDLAACNKMRKDRVFASRGLNGIDGQISTFFGMCEKDVENWGIIGDLTALYDLAGPWILSQMPETAIHLVIINNSGGKIFSTLFEDKEFQNQHSIQFAPVAALWNMPYEMWKEIPDVVRCQGHKLIEIVPDNDATARFHKKHALLETARLDSISDFFTTEAPRHRERK